MRHLSVLVTIAALASACSSTPSVEDAPPTAAETPSTAEQTAPKETIEEPSITKTDRGQRDPQGTRFDARLTLYEYPYEVKIFAFDAQRQALEMAYMDVQPTGPSNGATVLLLHGKNFSGAYWKNTIAALAEQGYRVVVPDQIGFGKSSKPDHYQFTFQVLATNTNALLDHLGVGPVAVVGHSMGGMLATRYALMFPDRTEKLVLVNPIGLEDWKLVAPYLTVDDWFQNELRNTPEKVQAYMKASYFDGQWKPEYDELAELQAGWTNSPDRERVAWSAALTYDMVFTQPVLYEFDELEVPTLLIIGQRDRTALGKNLVKPEVAETMGRYPELGRRAKAAISGAKLVELDGVGHIPQFEDWPRYIKALQTFLDAK